MKYRMFNLAPITAAVTTLASSLLAAPAFAQSPYAAADGTTIALSGTVESVSPDRFELDYGESTVTVEMDDGDRDADAYKLLSGDSVSVVGRVDDDLYESTTIEASSVYVENVDTVFYASSVDEESTFMPHTRPLEASYTTLRGRVSDVGIDDFTLNTGTSRIVIETDEMFNDPLDNEGYQQIDEGDIVHVTGHADIDLLENHSFEAESITTVIDTAS